MSAALNGDMKMPAKASTSREDFSDVDDDAHISAPAAGMKFQPLPETAATGKNSPQPRQTRSRTRATSAAKAIPNGSSKQTAAASPEHGFMNSMLDPVAATTASASAAAAAAAAGSQQLSHTPPAASSYESNHFGKRPRAGVSSHKLALVNYCFLFGFYSHRDASATLSAKSLAERLLASTELEEKGIINRDQKGILKDLIISGQDNELQHALDRYEQGDSSVLEGMLQTGTLSNKAAEEIDLLGDLNLDFLNVKDQGAAIAARSRGNSLASQPPGGNLSTASDGIGELDFDGGIGNWEQGSRSRSNSTWSQLEYVLSQQRSRANSTISIDLDNNRQRSNSLFSSLLGNDLQDSQANYGRWMDPNSAAAAAGAPAQLTQEQQLLQQQKHHEQHFQQLLLQQQQQRQQEEQAVQYEEDDEDEELDDDDEEDEEEEEEEVEETPRKRSGRRSSTSKASKERLKAQKKRERLLKKEQKDREKRMKKEKRELAKLAKQKKKQDGLHLEKGKEREEHVSGSGRPRSMSDPNLNVTLDADGLMQVERPEGWIGAYSPESRKVRIARFLEKRNHRVWTKTVKYDVRKNFADSRLRVKGRFVKKEDELLMRELMSLT